MDFPKPQDIERAWNDPDNIYLYVGKSESGHLRNRLLTHEMGFVLGLDMDGVTNNFRELDERHCEEWEGIHLVAIWLLPPKECGVAEPHLMDRLKPLLNSRREMSKEPWDERKPDILIDALSIRPGDREYWRMKLNITEQSGVYVWFVLGESRPIVAGRKGHEIRRVNGSCR